MFATKEKSTEAGGFDALNNTNGISKHLQGFDVFDDNNLPKNYQVATRDLSSKAKCRCAKCQAFGDCPNLIFVAVCATCYEVEQKRAERNRTERRWGIR